MRLDSTPNLAIQRSARNGLHRATVRRLRAHGQGTGGSESETFKAGWYPSFPLERYISQRVEEWWKAIITMSRAPIHPPERRTSESRHTARAKTTPVMEQEIEQRMSRSKTGSWPTLRPVLHHALTGSPEFLPGSQGIQHPRAVLPSVVVHMARSSTISSLRSLR